jgi:hypothetical protein
LEDCKHVLEASGLEQWMAVTDEEIKLKDCPVCKTPIAKTQRFMNIVKKVHHDVQAVKRRVFGNTRTIEVIQDYLKRELELVSYDSAGYMKGNVYQQSSSPSSLSFPLLGLLRPDTDITNQNPSVIDL